MRQAFLEERSCPTGREVMIRYSGYWGRRGYSRVIEVSQNSFSGSFRRLVMFTLMWLEPCCCCEAAELCCGHALRERISNK